MTNDSSAYPASFGYATDDQYSLFLAFGFLPGKEVKEVRVGNLGLRDRQSDLHRLVHVRSLFDVQNELP